MTSSVYPGAPDTFTNPTPADTMDGDTGGPAVEHATQHTLINDAVAAVETTVGNSGAFNFANNLVTQAIVTASTISPAANTFTPLDTTSNAIAVTLPTAPANNTRIGLKVVKPTGATTLVHAATYSTGGSDVINRAGGPTSGTLTLLSQAVTLQYQSSTHIWYVVADDLPLSSLNGTFVPIKSASLVGVAPGEYWVNKGTKAADTNSGDRYSPFLTLGAAITALNANNAGSGVVHVGIGTFSEGVLRPTGVVDYDGAGTYLTTLSVAANTNDNFIQDPNWGTETVGQGGAVRNCTIFGNKGSQTAPTADTLLTTSATITASGTVTLQVQSSAPFSASGGYLWAGQTKCSYTGTGSGTVLGVQALVAGTSITYYPGLLLTNAQAKGHVIAMQSSEWIVENVYIFQPAGSGIACQGASSISAVAPQITKARVLQAGRFSYEVGPLAPDGRMADCEGGNAALGDSRRLSADWVTHGYHPEGNTATVFNCTQAPCLIRVCADKNQDNGVQFDRPPWAAIIVDFLAIQPGVLSSYRVNGGNLLGSLAASGGMPVVQVVSSSAYNTSLSVGAVATLNYDLATTGRFERILQAGALGYTVGSQAISTSIPVSLQVVSAFPFDPLGSANGGVVAVTVASTGYQLSYTGVSTGTSATVGSTAIGATTMEVADGTQFAASGTVLAYPGDLTDGSVNNAEITYTGLAFLVGSSGPANLTGIPPSGGGSIAAVIPSGTGITQHFLTGVTVSSTVTTTDLLTLTQAARSPTLVNGDFLYSNLNNYRPTPWGGNSANIRAKFHGTQWLSSNSQSNPALLSITITAGNTTGTVAHDFSVAPTPKGTNPSQPVAVSVTASTSVLTATILTPLGSNLTVNVEAALTPG